MHLEEETQLPEYDDLKRDESVLWQVYVLELEDGCFYVGIALDVVKRFREHVNGKGANFTRLHKPIRVFEQVCSGTCEIKKARDLEDQKALAYAMKFGGDKVKGGRYFFPSKLGKKVQLLKSPGEQKTRQSWA